MKTVIYDICRKREAERCFKVKYKIIGWHRIDIDELEMEVKL